MDFEHDLSRFAWFHGNLSKDDADCLLETAPVGSFLVRNRSARPVRSRPIVRPLLTRLRRRATLCWCGRRLLARR